MLRLDIFLEVITIILIVIFAILARRNNRVFDYRMWVADNIARRTRQEFLTDKDWHWRYEELRKVSYEEMVYKFWRPLPSFFRNTKLEADIYER